MNRATSNGEAWASGFLGAFLYPFAQFGVWLVAGHIADALRRDGAPSNSDSWFWFWILAVLIVPVLTVVGAVLGAKSGVILASVRARDYWRLHDLAMNNLLWALTFGVLTLLLLRLLHQPYSSDNILRTLFLLTTNLPLQWAIALAVWACLAANRVKREERFTENSSA